MSFRSPLIVGLCSLFLLGCVQVLGIDDLPSGESDGGVDDASVSGSITVRFARGTSPVAGLRVVVHGPDGAVLANLVSDPTGEVVASFETGYLLTVALEATSTYYSLLTLADLEPGDSLDFALQEDGDIGTITIDLPPAPPGTTDEILASSSCMPTILAPTDTTVALSVDPTCRGATPTYDAILRARASGSTLAKSLASEVPVDTTASASAWITNLGTFTWTTDGTVQGRDLFGIAEVIDGRLFEDNAVVLPSGPGQIIFELQAAPFADFVATFACRDGLSYPCRPADGDSSLLRVDLTTAADLDIDMDALSVAFESVSYSSLQASWTGSAFGDYLVLTTRFDIAPAIPLGGAQVIDWRFVTDSDARQIAFPELPLELAGARPTNGVQPSLLTIEAVDHSYATGYRDAISQNLPFTDSNFALFHNRWPVRAGSVAVVVTSGVPD